MSIFSALLWSQPLSHDPSNAGAGAKLYRSYSFFTRSGTARPGRCIEKPPRIEAVRVADFMGGGRRHLSPNAFCFAARLVASYAISSNSRCHVANACRQVK